MRFISCGKQRGYQEATKDTLLLSSVLVSHFLNDWFIYLFIQSSVFSVSLSISSSHGAKGWSGRETVFVEKVVLTTFPFLSLFL